MLPVLKSIRNLHTATSQHAVLLLFFYIETKYLNIYWTDPHEIYGFCTTLAVDQRSEVIFFDPSIDVAVATSFVGKIDLQYSPIVRMTFARAAPRAYNKKRNCCAGRRQTNYLTRWTQANQLTDQLTVINRR